MGGGRQNEGGAIPLEDALSWMFRPPVTQEQTDQWFQPAAQPSQLPDPPPYEQPRFARNLGQAVSEIGPELQGMVQAPVEFAKRATDPNLSVPSRLAAAVGAVASATQLDPLLPRAATKLPAGEGFVWGAKPIENIQGLPKSGVMPEGRFTKAASEAGAFSKDELALMKQVVPDAFTETGVHVPKLYEGLERSGPVVEVKKLGSSAPEHARLAQLTHELDTRFGGWNEDPAVARTPEEARLVAEHRDLINMPASPTSGGAQYAFVGPKPEAQMPGYVEGLVRLPQKQIPLSESDLALRGGINPVEPPLYQGPHFGSEDSNVLSSYRGYEETLPNGEKAFHVIEVQSDWGQAHREEAAKFQEHVQSGKLVDTDMSRAGYFHNPEHPLLPHYETLGLKAAIQHAKEIGASKVILPDAETAMMTEGHDKQVRPEIIDSKDMGPRNEGLEKLQVQYPSPRYSIQPEGGKFNIYDNEKIARPSQEGGMRLHYDQTLPSAMRKLTGDKGEPIDLGTHKFAYSEETLRRAEQSVSTPVGSPVFKDAAGKPKTNITGKIYDISKTPDQFKLMKAGDKFSLAKYLAS